MNIILASQSPRRRELLGLFRIPFTVQVADIDETMDPNSTPDVEVGRVSARKAAAIERGPEDLVIAADTIVVCDGQILGKPKDEADAFRMLKLLSGRAHQVMTGMTVLYGDQAVTHTEITHIHFRPLSDWEIHAYIRTGDPMDKAGSYGIQSGAALFADRLEGDYFNVVGLPVCRLSTILNQIAPEMMEETP